MRITATILCITLRLLWAAQTSAQSIDTTFSRSLDVTGDGRPDLVTLHVQAQDIHHPFHWTLTISSGAHTLYRYDEDGIATEFRFTERSQCNQSYVQCKWNYFARDLAGLRVSRKPSFGTSEFRFKRSYSGSVYQVAFSFLVTYCNMDTLGARSATEAIAHTMKSNAAIYVSHNTGDTESSLPMVYCPEANCLVPVYSD